MQVKTAIGGRDNHSGRGGQKNVTSEVKTKRCRTTAIKTAAKTSNMAIKQELYTIYCIAWQSVHTTPRIDACETCRMISDQLLNPSHTQPRCLADKSKVEQAVKRFGTAVQLSGFESVSDALPHASALQKKKKKKRYK